MNDRSTVAKAKLTFFQQEDRIVLEELPFFVALITDMLQYIAVQIDKGAHRSS